MKKKTEPVAVDKPAPTPRERAERYRGVVSKLQLNEELANRRAARAKAQLDRELVEAGEHAARHALAKQQLERLETEVTE